MARPLLLRQRHGEDGLKALVEQHLGDIDAREVNTVPLAAHRHRRARRQVRPVPRARRRPADAAARHRARRADPERAEEILAQGNQEHELGVDPDSGRTIALRAGRYGPYVTEAAREGATEKPKTASLLKTMTPETVTLEDALRLLTLPRTLGEGWTGKR